MKLEVGMYVRTKKGYIYKLSRYEEDNNRWISSEEMIGILFMKVWLKKQVITL